MKMFTDDIKDFFLDQGQIMDADGKCPLFLNEGYVWIILEGQADVFYYTERTKGVKGPLSYLFSVNKGGALIGNKAMAEDTNHQEITLIGKGQLGTQLIKMERSKFFNLGKDKDCSVEIARLMNQWLGHFHPFSSVECRVLEIHPGSGSGNFDELYLSGLRGISEHHKNKINDNRKSLQKKQDYNDSLFNEAFSKLASVIQKDFEENTDSHSMAPLFDALKNISNMSGIKFSYPPASDDMHDIDKCLHSIAEMSKIRLRKVNLKNEWWKMDNGPMLGFLSDSTPVALLYVSPGRYILKNPLTKETHQITNETSGNLSSNAYYFYRCLPNDREVKLKDIFQFVLTHDHARDLKFLLILGLAGGILGMIAPYFSGLLFDIIIPEAKKYQLIQVILALLTVSFSIAVFQFARAIAFLRIEGKLDVSIQSAVIDRLVNLPVSFFRKYTAGDLADRANSVNKILQAFTNITVDSLISGIFSSLNILLLFYYSAELALFAVGATAFYLMIVSTGYYFIFHHQRLLVKINGKLIGQMLQLMNGIPKLRIAGAEKRSFFLWAKEYSQLRKESFKIGTLSNYIAVLNALHPILVMSSIFALITFFINKNFTTGDFVAFSAAFTVFQSSIINMFLANLSILKIIPLYERVKPILDSIPELDYKKSYIDELTGAIELNSVSFRYTGEAPFVLNDVSLKIEPGQFIAIVGPSGSGKSSLLRIFLGFEKPTKGRIFFDNHDLYTLNVPSLRKQIGVVLQNGELIPDSILNNIIGMTRATYEDAWEAARCAGIDKDISEMPMKMFTKINEGAGTISSGQKQRILIARAIVNRPKILLFDEATSALDNTTQAIIMDNLKKIRATKVVIAHRLSTIVNADLIYVLDKGKIVQSGTFEELLNQKGLFSDIAGRQLLTSEKYASIEDNDFNMTLCDNRSKIFRMEKSLNCI